jgi:hypothetical protein
MVEESIDNKVQRLAKVLMCAQRVCRSGEFLLDVLEKNAELMPVAVLGQMLAPSTVLQTCLNELIEALSEVWLFPVGSPPAPLRGG